MITVLSLICDFIQVFICKKLGMKKNKLPVRFTGQHFTIDKVLINDAIELAQIEKNDNVLDIGAGKGFITIHLTRKCNNVIAIENDLDLIENLRQKFHKNPKVKVVNVDFRSFIFPDNSFKVVSSIPFRITSDILRLLMYDNLISFMGGSLIMSFKSVQKLFAKKVFNPYTIFYNIVKSLVAKNNTVVIIEHNLDIIKYADWIIDMGPEGGKNGGEILFQGTPEDLVNCRDSYTGRFLKL